MIDPTPTLKDYQQSDYSDFRMRYLRGDTACICEWAPGLGKSLLSILLARHFNAARVLIVGPSISLTSWAIELQKWWPSATVLAIAAGKDIRKLRDQRVVIVTHDLIGRNDEVRLRLRDWQTEGFAFGVLDEAQYLRGPNTKRTGGSYGRGEGVFTYTDKMLILSGTLVVSWPDDLWTHLARWMPERITLDGKRMDYETFRDRYLKTREVPIPGAYRATRTQIYGYREEMMPELRERLRDFSIKREKSEAGLPPLTWRVMDLELAASDRKQIETELMDHLPERLQVLARRASQNPNDDTLAFAFAERLAEYEELWGVAMRVLGVGKAKALSRVLKEKLQNTPRTHGIGIFSLNRKVMDVFDAELKDFGVVRIDGSTPPGPARARIVEAYQSDTGPRVFNGQIDACGTALTLTRGDTCYFPQLSPTPGANEQAASRFHRIGQQNPVDAWIPCVRGTLDQPLMGILRKKMKTQAALRGEA
jgi:SNF2 family DNA or RNA helicase